uniref:Uncharacterized protein n=1 Tax=Panagrellus redivivus TaxID=6233 RepID=A0A7E4W0L6_PANRE
MSKPAAADAEVSAPGETLYASEVKTASPNTGAKQCNIYENDTLHAVMDRICELCHNMFSHENPNMRAQCRADCFRTEQFRRCLLLFRPGKAQRHVRHISFRHMPIPLSFGN